MGYMAFSEERCVMCGALVPEGTQVCGACERSVLYRNTEEREKKEGQSSEKADTQSNS